MKILYLLAISPKSFISGSTQSFLTFISSSSCKAYVVSPIYHELLYNKLNLYGIKYETINYRPFTYPCCTSFKDLILYLPRWIKILYTSIYSIYKLSLLVKKIKPDIIHSNTSTIPYGYWVAKLFKIPHIWHIREYMEKDYGLHPIPSRIYHNRRINKSYSISITKGLAKYINAGTLNHVIYNGICSKNDIKFIPNKENYFLYVGLLDKAKGINDVLHAYIEYYNLQKSSKPLSLIIVGEGNLRNNIEYIIKNEKLSQHVQLLGGLNSIKVRELMEKATALIMSSHHEAFGRVTAEAMFAGCLVIGKDTEGTKEQFDNGKNITQREIGLRYSTIDELSKHMINIHKNGIDKYFPMIKNAQDVVCQLYSTEEYIANIEKIYKQIIKNENN